MKVLMSTVLNEGHEGQSTREFTVTSPDGNDDVEVWATYNWYYEPGRRYMPNGDPGYPDSSEVELLEFGTISDDEQPEWLTFELVQKTLDNEDDLFDDMYDDDDYDEDYYEDR